MPFSTSPFRSRPTKFGEQNTHFEKRGKSRFPVFRYNIVKSRAIVSSLLPRCTCDFLLFFLCGRSNMGRDRKFLFRFSDFQIFRNEKDGCPEASVGFSTRRAVTPTFRRFHGRRRRMAEDTMATRKLRRRRAREREREREREKGNLEGRGVNARAERLNA